MIFETADSAIGPHLNAESMPSGLRPGLTKAGALGLSRRSPARHAYHNGALFWDLSFIGALVA
jgi:hypothetical protein